MEVTVDTVVMAGMINALQTLRTEINRARIGRKVIITEEMQSC